jgi:hypothetical protein
LLSEFLMGKLPGLVKKVDQRQPIAQLEIVGAVDRFEPGTDSFRPTARG